MAVLMWMLEVPSTDERSKLTRAPPRPGDAERL